MSTPAFEARLGSASTAIRRRRPGWRAPVSLAALLGMLGSGAALALGTPQTPPALVDFDGDGHDDLAVSALGADLATVPGANHGAVAVYYGLSLARPARPPQHLAAAAPASGDGFGIAVRTGDFNADDYTDLAVAATGATVAGVENAGSVRIFYGSSRGLVAGPTLSDRCATPAAGDQFGSALAAGDLDGDRIDDLAVGIPHTQRDGLRGVGSAAVFSGAPSGLGARCISALGARGAHGPDRASARFGSALEIGDLDDDGVGDLAVGAPGQRVGGIAGGAVHVLFGCADGCPAGERRVVLAPSAGGAGDSFGFSLAVGEFGRGGSLDLAVGSPGAAVDGVPDAGAVSVFHGPVASADEVRITQNAAGVPDVAEGRAGVGRSCPPPGCDFPDSFGRTLLAGPLAAGRWDTLVVGVQFEDVDGMVDAGAVQVFPGGPDGLRPDGAVLREARSPGGLFGSSMAIANLGGGPAPDLAVAAPREDLGAIRDAGAVHLLLDDGTRRLLTQGERAQPEALFGGILSHGLG